MTDEKNKSKIAMTGAILGAVTASLCCILPLVAAVIGFTGFAASQFFEHWRPYFLAVTLTLLAAGFYLAYRRPREACEFGSLCERTPIGRWNRAALWLVAVLVVVLAAFPYYSGWVARAVTKTNVSAEAPAQSSQAHVVLKIDGMYCSSCAVLLGKNLARIPGVRRAEVSFENKQATLDYDPLKVDFWRFAKSITDAGYKVAGTATVTN
jgi:mercuric ion transport protein